jgi:hypothetical protein
MRAIALDRNFGIGYLQSIEQADPTPAQDEVVFAFEDTQTAFEYLEQGQHFGKVVITLELPL